MVYNEPSGAYRYRVERELVMPAKISESLPGTQTFSFDTFEEAFKFYENMYRMDKACWEMLKDDYMNRGIADESKHPDSYSFSLYRRYLSVRLVNMLEVAREAFSLEEGMSHG